MRQRWSERAAHRWELLLLYMHTVSSSQTSSRPHFPVSSLREALSTVYRSLRIDSLTRVRDIVKKKRRIEQSLLLLLLFFLRPASTFHPARSISRDWCHPLCTTLLFFPFLLDRRRVSWIESVWSLLCRYCNESTDLKNVTFAIFHLFLLFIFSSFDKMMNYINNKSVRLFVQRQSLYSNTHLGTRVSLLFRRL